MSPTHVHVLSVLTLCLGAQGFNFAPHHSEIFTDPTGDLGSYFGYSLGFWQQTSHAKLKTWLLVGAPRGQVEGLTGERVHSPGVVYKCPLGSEGVRRCTAVPILGEDERNDQNLTWRGKYTTIPARAWIGGTIAVENKPNGGVVVCGPRMKRWMGEYLRYIPGTCYYWEGDERITALPLIESKYPNKYSGFESGFAQVGMSADFLQKTNKTQLVLGSPGIQFFKGAVSVYERDGTKAGLPNLNMPSATEVNYDSYMGYSVTSGRFHRDGSVSYIAGAPRAEGSDIYSGAVYVVQNHQAKTWRAVTTLKGHQMGEYFGAVEAAMDLDMDGVDDLLVVGAPMHCPQSKSEAASNYDLGAVYVYINRGEAQLDLLEPMLTGSSVSGARFGSSLAVVGDINKDGFTDLAVGAPYEGSGVVYLYHGQDNYQGLRSRYSQRIAASDIDPQLRGFGISISGGLDIDGNSFNDIAVGSHESSSAVVVKSYPVIDFDATLESSVKRLDMDAEQFSVKACLRYTTRGDPRLITQLEAVMTLKVDPTLRRSVFQNPLDSSEEQSLTIKRRLRHGVDFCTPLNVILKNSFIQVVRPIEIFMEYKASNSPLTNRDREASTLCPMADPLKPSSIRKMVPFAHGCKSKTTCKADLRVEVESSSNGQPLVLGKHKTFTLLVTVHNSGDPAYLSTLAATLPGKNMLLKVPTLCYQDEAADVEPHQERFMCNLGKSLGDNVKKVSIRFEVDLTGVDLSTPYLGFNFTAWSASEEINPEDNTYIVSVPIALESRIELHGGTTMKNVILSSNASETSPFVPVVHKYEVVNFGPSPVGSVQVVFRVPVAWLGETSSEGKVFLTFPDPQTTIDGQIFRCNVDRSALKDSRIASQDISRFENSLQSDQPPQPHPKISTEDYRLRRKRWVIEEIEANVTNLEEVHQRRTLHLNCTGSKMEGMPEVVCVVITCEAGPLAARGRADISLQLSFYKPVLESLARTTDAVQFKTSGAVSIVDQEKYRVTLDSRETKARVETVFMGEVTGEEVAPWILPLAIALGLLVFLLVVKGLSNIGFFKRGDKEKLELLREEAVALHEEFGPNTARTRSYLEDNEY